jgi:hypothetical protein
MNGPMGEPATAGDGSHRASRPSRLGELGGYRVDDGLVIRRDNLTASTASG